MSEQTDRWTEAKEKLEKAESGSSEVLCFDKGAAQVCDGVVNILRESKYSTAWLLLALTGMIVVIAREERDGWRTNYCWGGREGFVIIEERISLLSNDRCRPVVKKGDPVDVIQPLVLRLGFSIKDIIRSIDAGIGALVDNVLSN